MLSASQEFRDKLIKGSPVYSKARITLLDGTIINLDCKDFLYGTSGFRISTATSNDNSFDIGACIVGQLDLKILNYSGQFNIYSFDKARVEVWVYMSLSGDSIEANKFISPSADIIDAGDVADMENVTQIYDGGVFENKHIESIKKGVFYVDSQNFNGGVVSLTCYDKLMAFNTDYTGSSVTMPASQWVNELANRHGLSVKNSRFNNSTLELTLPTDKTYTDLQLLNYILQCTGNYAKINEDELLEISWYDVGKINSYNIIDAGDFNNPSVDVVDAGGVADMEDVATIYSGGTFEERKDDKYTIHIFNNPTVDIDDVVVTGVRTILDDDTSVLAGSEGYVLKVEKNPFINSDNQQDITERLWEVCQGLTFRPMSITTLNDPLIQTGDIMQVQIKGNVYTSLVTSISYTQGGHTQIKCSAESPTKNSTKIGSKPLGIDKKVNGIVDKRLTAYDIGVQMLTNLITQSMGLYETPEVQEDGSTIYIMHDKPKLSDSMKLWKMTANGLAVSNDGGDTWNSGWDVNGNAVMNILSVIGINFDWAKGGTLTLGGENNANGVMNVLDSNGNIIAKLDVNGLKVDKGAISGNLVKGGTIIGAAFRNADSQAASSFYVTANGYMHAADGDIAGLKISSNSLYSQYGGTNISSNSIGSSSVNAGSSTLSTIGGSLNMDSNGGLQWGDYYCSTHGDNRHALSPTTTSDLGKDYSSAWWDAWFGGSVNAQWGVFSQGISVGGSIWDEPSKEAVINTQSYGKRALRCYETATPMFGDIGTATLDDDGVCYVYLDDIFLECINSDVEYVVFLQPYGKGDCYIAGIEQSYFIVKGEPGLRFAWEVKCNQIANNGKRLEDVTNREVLDNDENTRILNELTYENELYVDSLINT